VCDQNGRDTVASVQKAARGVSCIVVDLDYSSQAGQEGRLDGPNFKNMCRIICSRTAVKFSLLL